MNAKHFLPKAIPSNKTFPFHNLLTRADGASCRLSFINNNKSASHPKFLRVFAALNKNLLLKMKAKHSLFLLLAVLLAPGSQRTGQQHYCFGRKQGYRHPTWRNLQLLRFGRTRWQLWQRRGLHPYADLRWLHHHQLLPIPDRADSCELYL